MRLVVISDLHIGSGALDDCDAELEQALVAFLEEVAAAADPTMLVINGDLLDFVQADPWQDKDLQSTAPDGTPLCFSEEQSVEKLRSIIRSHRPVFEALGRLTHEESRHEVVVLPGNHDADFFWHGVQRAFAAALAAGRVRGAARLRFHLEQSFRPASLPGLWIEHGHQYDDCNRFCVAGAARWSEAAPPILTGPDGVPRLIECVGTRFMLRFLNSLDADYPFVDNVKPFSKFVRMFLSSTVHAGFGPVKAMVTYWGFLRFVARTLGRSPQDLLSVEAFDEEEAKLFRARLLELSDEEAERVAEVARGSGFDFEEMPFNFYIQYDERLRKLLDVLTLDVSRLGEVGAPDSAMLGAGDPGYLTLGGGYLTDETAVLRAAARRLIVGGTARAVIMGHTHEPVVPDTGLNYVNTGCWTRYLRDENGGARSWDLLKRSAYESFPYELGYAEARGDSAATLSRMIFLPSQTRRDRE